MGWATVADVQRLTGKPVQDSDVDQATAIIEIVSGADADLLNASNLSARNLKWLRYAVCYQCAFMTEHPDYFTRMDVSTISQDSVSATIRPDGLVLAPNARRCLKRLSWRGTRTVQVNGGLTSTIRGYRVSDGIPGYAYDDYGQSGSAQGATLASDDYLDSLPWTPGA